MFLFVLKFWLKIYVVKKNLNDIFDSFLFCVIALINLCSALIYFIHLLKWDCKYMLQYNATWIREYFSQI